MQARKAFLTPLSGSILIGLAVVVLTLIVLTAPANLADTNFSAERHVLFEYFVTFLSLGLFLVLFHHYRHNPSNSSLFLTLGFFSFVIIQILQILVAPGFHYVAWLQTSLNLSLGFDVVGRFLFSLHFLFAVLFLSSILSDFTFKKKPAFYFGSLFILLCASSFLFAWQPTFVLLGELSPLAKALEICTAVLFFVCGLLLIRKHFKEAKPIYFWFLLASILSIFVCVYFIFWDSQFHILFHLGHVLKIFSFSTFWIAFLLVQTQSRSFKAGFEKAFITFGSESELTFHELVERLSDGVAIFDKDKKLVFCNQAFSDMLSYSNDKIISWHYSVFFDNQTNELESCFESEATTKEGEKLPVLVNEWSVSDSSGEIIGFQYVISDLSRQKEVQAKFERLLQEKAKEADVFQQCIEHSTEGLLITDLNGHISYVNGAFEKMSGYSRNELVGNDTSVLMHDKRGEIIHEAIWSTVKEGKVWRGEFHTRKKGDGLFLGEISVVPIQEREGKIARYLWIEKDITRRKTLEKSLQRYTTELTEKTRELESSKTYYQTLISGMTDILLVVDNDGQCTFINDYGRKRLNYEAYELSKQKLPIFFDDLKRLEKDYGSAIEVEIKDFEAIVKTKDDESIVCSWHARPLFDRDNGRTGAMAVGRDITEYKKLQNKLEEHAKSLEDKVELRTEELQTKVNQLAKLLEIGEEIRLNVDVDVILNKICEAVQALGWRKVVITLRDREKQASCPVAAAGLEPRQVEEVMSWREIPFEHTDRYFKEPFRISNSYFVGHEAQITNKNTPFSVYSDLGEAKEDEWHSLDGLLVPIRTKDNILGIISVDDPVDRKRPGIEKIRDLEIFADKAALAIENARLFQAQKENERHDKFLAEISQIFHSSLKMNDVLEAIVQKGGKAIGEFCSLLLLDELKGLLEPQACYHPNPQVVDRFLKGIDEFPCNVGEGLVGIAAVTGKPFHASKPFSEDLNNFKSTLFASVEQYHSISSLMVIPLRARSGIIGALVYLSCESGRTYRNEELKLAVEFAERAALAVENARLFKEAGEKAKELQKASQLKSEFLASVSHELRTPLNAIITLSDILLRGMSGNLNADQSKQLEIIQRSGRNLLNLINDILDLAKVESQKVEPIYSNIPVRCVVEETIEHIRPLCIKKGLKLEHSFESDIPEFIYTDQDKLTKALTNLLSNAVKFTRKGRITVEVGLENETYLKIEVSDTGIGIPKDRIDEIFKEFRQIDNSDSRAYAGTGLGLAITRKVLDVIGGSISVSSQLGKGSKFSILVPIQSKAEVKQEDVSDLDKEVAEKEPEPAQIDFPDDRDHLDEQGKSVLVIDDEQEAIYVMRKYLHERNYKIICPRNGEDVIELAKQYRPFAITLDLIMPDQDGWEILKILKSEPATRQIPVVITSILSEQKRAFEMGADEYLVKPFDSQKLFGLLATLDTSTRKSVISDLGRFLASKRQNLFSKKSNSNAGTRILLVDDDRDTQYVLKYILEEAGYSLYFANEGLDAIKQAESVRPNLILMDIMMPGMNGYEATRKIKSKDTFSNVPIVAMTAKAMKGDREKTILAGCDDYIAKPFVTDDILNMVHKWLQISKSN